MGNQCCIPQQLPAFNKKQNPYTAGTGSNIPSLLLISKHVPSKLPSIISPQYQFQSKGPIEKLTFQESKEIGIQMIVPSITAPVIEIPEIEVSIIRTQQYLQTIQAAVKEQQKSKTMQLQMLQQQAMLQAQLQYSKRIQIEQQRQLVMKQEKEALLLKHGPAPAVASPTEIPPVSKHITERRKQLQMMRYAGEVKGMMLNPFKFHNNGVVYFGQWENGQPHGKGLIYFVDGSVFEGGFVNGKPLGKGRLISQNGDYYEGQVLGSSASGRGISQNSLVRYQGFFQNNIQHGQGVETSLDGKTRFTGQFFKGSKKQGTLIWGQNHQYIYQGFFSNNLFQGIGSLKSSGGIYKGTFHENKKHGNGRYEWTDGRVFEGGYLDDMKSGYGELFNIDGTLSYKGEWKNDYPNGIGTTVSNGVLTTGQWVNGEYIG